MGRTDDALARVAQRHNEERAFVRTMTRRLDAAEVAAERARHAIAAAEEERARVLGEWASAPGWSVAQVAEHAGVEEREVAGVVRAAGRAAAAPNRAKRADDGDGGGR